MVHSAPEGICKWLHNVVRTDIPPQTVNLLLYATVLHPDAQLDLIRTLVLVPHLARCVVGPLPSIPPCLVHGYSFAVVQASGLGVDRVQQWLNNEMAMYCVHRSMRTAPWAATWLGCLSLFVALPGQHKQSLVSLRRGSRFLKPWCHGSSATSVATTRTSSGPSSR